MSDFNSIPPLATRLPHLQGWETRSCEWQYWRCLDRFRCTKSSCVALDPPWDPYLDDCERIHRIFPSRRHRDAESHPRTVRLLPRQDEASGEDHHGKAHVAGKSSRKGWQAHMAHDIGSGCIARRNGHKSILGMFASHVACPQIANQLDSSVDIGIGWWW